MEMMTSCASLFKQQMELMNQMFKDITDLTAKEAELGAMVIQMGGDVSQLSTEVSKDEELMLEVTNCMGVKQ